MEHINLAKVLAKVHPDTITVTHTCTVQMIGLCML